MKFISSSEANVTHCIMAVQHEEHMTDNDMDDQRDGAEYEEYEEDEEEEKEDDDG